MLSTADLKTISEIFEKMEGNDFKLVHESFNFYKQKYQMIIKSEFRVGDSVYFSSRTGIKYSGIISKINKKNIQVICANEIWDVSPSLLTKG